MSDICKFVKKKNLSVFLSASMLVINCLSPCLSVGFQSVFSSIYQSARVFYHICLHLSTVGLLSVSRLTDQSVRLYNCR